MCWFLNHDPRKPVPGFGLEILQTSSNFSNCTSLCGRDDHQGLNAQAIISKDVSCLGSQIW